MEENVELSIKNPFSGFNASLMDVDEIIKYWIKPRQLFGKQAGSIDLTGNSPVVLMGGRGTGKTMLLKFMSNEVQIKDYISKHIDGQDFLKNAKYVGIYHRFDGSSFS